MKLITELNESVISLVEAAEGGKKHWIIEGTWMQGNLKNRNGRIYPMGILEREVLRYQEQYIAKNRAVGELGHPEGPSINLDRVSHRILEMKKDGDNFYGRAMLLDTEKGFTAQKLLEGGMQLGVSSRGMGTLKENRDGVQEVQEDFYLATAGDIVADPSAPDAFVNGIMEGVDWSWAPNGTIVATRADVLNKIVEDTRKDINTAVRKRALTEENKMRIFSRFLKTLG